MRHFQLSDDYPESFITMGVKTCTSQHLSDQGTFCELLQKGMDDPREARGQEKSQSGNVSKSSRKNQSASGALSILLQVFHDVS